MWRASRCHRHNRGERRPFVSEQRSLHGRTMAAEHLGDWTWHVCVCCVNSSLSDLTEGEQKFLVRQTLTCRSDTFPSFSQLPKTRWGFPVLLSSLCHFSSGCLSFSHTRTRTAATTLTSQPAAVLVISSTHTPEPPDYHHPTPRETMALSSRLKLWEQKGGAEFRARASDWASGVFCSAT